MIRMQHHDDVGAELERLQITGLLVSAVAAVLDMDHHRQTERTRNVHRLVLADIIDEDNIRYEILWNVIVGLLQRFGGIIRWQDNDDARTLVHLVKCTPSPTGRG